MIDQGNPDLIFKLQVEDLSFNGSDNDYVPSKESEEKLRQDLESSESSNNTPMIMGCMSTCELRDAREEVRKVRLLLLFDSTFKRDIRYYSGYFRTVWKVC